jgi:hypothetical protein
LRSRSLIGLAIKDDLYAGGNPIDHSCNTYDRGHGGDQIRDNARQAGQDRTTHEAEAAEKRYPASLARSLQLVPG